MSKKVKPYKIERVEELPLPKRKLKEIVYDEVIKEILDRPKGYYRIEIEGKKLKSMYPAFKKRILAKNLPLKLRVRGSELYIEKVE